MAVTLEQVDIIRKRLNVSYEVAREALEESDGDVLEALINLENQSQVKSGRKCKCKGQCKCQQNHPSFKDNVKVLIKKGNENRFVIKKDEDTVINVPVNTAIVASVLTLPVAAVGITAALVTKHSVKVQKPDGNDINVNKVFDKVSDAMSTASDKVSDVVGTASGKVSEAVNTASEKVTKAIHKDKEEK